LAVLIALCVATIGWAAAGAGGARAPVRSQAVSAGDGRTCAATSDDSMVCWVYPGWREAPPPAGALETVRNGYAHVCALSAKSEIICWGDSRAPAAFREAL
jgi:hypothetical protein